jgi:hypothetical protein
VSAVPLPGRLVAARIDEIEPQAEDVGGVGLFLALGCEDTLEDVGVVAGEKEAGDDGDVGDDLAASALVRPLGYPAPTLESILSQEAWTYHVPCSEGNRLAASGQCEIGVDGSNRTITYAMSSSPRLSKLDMKANIKPPRKNLAPVSMKFCRFYGAFLNRHYWCANDGPERVLALQHRSQPRLGLQDLALRLLGP